MFEENQQPFFLTEEYQYSAKICASENQQYAMSNEDLMCTEDYQRGYQNSLTQVQRKYGLRSRNFPLISNQKKQNSQTNTQQKEVDAPNRSK